MARTDDLSKSVLFAMETAQDLAYARNHMISDWHVDRIPMFSFADGQTYKTASAKCVTCNIILIMRSDGKIESELSPNPCVVPKRQYQDPLMEDD